MICCVIFAVILLAFGVTVISALMLEKYGEEGFVPVEGDLAPITIITADRDNV